MFLYELFLFFGALFGVIAFFRTAKLKKRIFDLELKLNQSVTKSAESKKKKAEDQLEVAEATWTKPSVTKYPQYQPTPPNQDIQQILSDPIKPITSLVMPAHDTREPSQDWEVIAPEKFNLAISWFKENWAGIFGVTILVLGIAFAAAYVGYFATPFIRFLMVLGVGLLLLVAALILRRRAPWQELSSWLQSASGAVVLLAMIGSQTFQTLQFYQDPLIGLILLSMGLIYNVLLAYFSPKQMQASLHVLISLCALLVAPKELVVFVAAIIVTLSGIGLSIRNTWNINLILTYFTFTIFHFSWFIAQTNIPAIALYGVIGISIVGASSLLVHYRKIYQEIEAKHNLFTHVSVWILLGSQYLLYNFGFKYLFIPVGLAAIASLASALYAKKQRIDWLFQCDALMGQLLALFAIGSLARVEFRREFIPWLATIESLAFATIAYCTQQKLLSKCGMAFVYLSFIALCAHLLSMDPNYQEVLLITIGTLAPIYGVRWYLARSEPEENDNIFEDYNHMFPFLLDVLMFGLGIVVIMTPLLNTSLGYVTALAVLLCLALNKAVIHHDGHKGIYLLFVAIMIGVGWFKMGAAGVITHALLWYFLPATFLLFGLLWLKILSFNQEQDHFEDLWIYFLGIHFGIGAYLLLGPISEYLPGICYLILATVFFELAVLVGNRMRSSRGVLLAAASKNMAMIFVLVYCALYITLYMQSEVSILPYLSMNELLSLVVVVMCSYWYYTAPLTNDDPELSNRASVAVLPLTQAVPFDLAIIMALTFIISAFSAPIHPIGYGLIAFMLVIPIYQRYLPPRAGIYAVVLLFALCVQVAVVSSTWASPSSSWYQTTHITGPLSLLIGVAVVSCLLKEPEDSHENKLLRLYYSSPILIGFLPLFTSLALFLAWRFDKAFLTMLWVVEIVSIVILGYYLKSKALVHIAFAFLIICVLRLVFYDLGQTDLLIRAVVFVIVGLLMIFIHMIYKKYANRLT